jgi:hypothetical protein
MTQCARENELSFIFFAAVKTAFKKRDWRENRRLVHDFSKQRWMADWMTGSRFKAVSGFFTAENSFDPENIFFFHPWGVFFLMHRGAQPKPATGNADAKNSGLRRET